MYEEFVVYFLCDAALGQASLAFIYTLFHSKAMRMVKPSTVTQHACTSAHKMGSKESRCAQNLIFILKKTPTMPVAAIAVVSKHKSEFAARNLV